MNLREVLTESNLFTDGLSVADWLKCVGHLSAQLQKHPAQKWLLFDDDVQSFSVLFFALLTAQKQIVLPPSNQPGLLLSLKPHVDATIGSAGIAGMPHLTIDNHVDNSDAAPLTTPLIIAAEQNIEFFTSGSSGQASKISKSWRQLNNEINALEQLWSSTLERSMIVATVSHQHIYGLIFKLLWPLLTGQTIHNKQLSYPEELNALAHSDQAQPFITLVSSPAFLARTADEPLWTTHAKRLTTVFSSGGPLQLDTAQTLNQQLGHSPLEVLGSTETGGIAWRQQATQNPPLWQPFAAITIKVDAEQRLHIQSPYLPDDHWYATDDRVKMHPIHDKELQFELLGRTDRIVKIEQKRLSLDALENTLSEHDWIKQCRALIIPGKRDQIAVAMVLTQAGKDSYNQQQQRTFNRQLRQYLGNHFEAVLLPRKWRYVAALPTNSQGKLSYQDLLSLFTS